MLDYCIYLLYRAEAAALARLPFRFLFVVGQVAGFCGWLLFGNYRRLAWHNVKIAFGNEKSPRELRRLVRRHFQQLCSNLLCNIRLNSLPVEKALERVEIDNIESIGRCLHSGVPVVLALSHLANWEVFAQFMPKFFTSLRTASVYQPLRNCFIDAHVRRTRSRTGLELFDRKQGFQPVIDLLRSGGGVGILSDQHAGDQGLWTPFFGRLASTSPLPALLAKRTRAALIAAAVYTIAPGRWRMVITERFDSPEASVEELTLRTNRIIEEQIRRAPQDWLWAHNRWKTPHPNFLLAKYKRGIYLPRGLSANKLQPFRILIRSPNWLGDAIMSVPAVRAIKAGRPDAHVTIAAPDKITAMWKLVREVDDVLALPSRSLLSTARLIRQQRIFDVAILFPNSLRAALEVWLARVPRRFGYRGHRRYWLLNQRMRQRPHLGPVEHHSKHYLRLAAKCGAETENAGLPTQTPKTKIDNLEWKLALSPGAEYGPAKRWLPERFAEAAAIITAKTNASWVLLGTIRDVDPGKKIASNLDDRCVNLIGETSLDQLIEQLRQCSLLLTNDTGTMHLAALLGVPTVSIFGSTEPRLTGPLGQGHIILRHQVECSPCFLRECPIDFRCMAAVTVADVVDAVMSILETRVKTPSNS